MKNHWLINFTVGALMIVMFFLMLGSIKDDVPIVDEVPHIGAGYSYLAKRDSRMNPEHPPLIKNLAAAPLMFLNLNSPFKTGAWERGMRDAGQWYFGRDLLFTVGNNPQKIMFWSRLPMILLTILLGLLIFKWSRELFGNLTALVILAFYAFSPTFLAHGRFVTTDLGAAIGVFAATYYFWRFLKKPSAKNIFWAGIVFGLAQLTKYSVVLLIPFFAGAAIIWIIVRSRRQPPVDSILKYGAKIFGGLILVGLIGSALAIWPVYQFQIQDYPPERQLEDAASLLSSFGFRPAVDSNLWLISQPIFRAFGQYLLGLLMVFQRAAGGNTTYFLGEVSATSWWYYFPAVYLLKETLALHILTLTALIYCGFKTAR
ncbi:MAG: glycosyltransferase family 39 protein, partial [bacterium]|nr:glycosyltransferase family 39 protein [bacterium]